MGLPPRPDDGEPWGFPPPPPLVVVALWVGFCGADTEIAQHRSMSQKQTEEKEEGEGGERRSGRDPRRPVPGEGYTLPPETVGLPFPLLGAGNRGSSKPPSFCGGGCLGWGSARPPHLWCGLGPFQGEGLWPLGPVRSAGRRRSRHRDRTKSIEGGTHQGVRGAALGETISSPWALGPGSHIERTSLSSKVANLVDCTKKAAYLRSRSHWQRFAPSTRIFARALHAFWLVRRELAVVKDAGNQHGFPMTTRDSLVV